MNEIVLPLEEGDAGEMPELPQTPAASPPVVGRIAFAPLARDVAEDTVDIDDSPFEPAPQTRRRLKLFLWGDTGTGKTCLALQFPRPVVIDLEAGTEHYGGRIAFDRLRDCTSADKIHAAVDWLATHQHRYATLVVDPFTVYWEMLQHKWGDIFLRRNRGKGYKHEFYQLQPADWVQIKAELKTFIRALIALDMNVIVTAREKTRYAPGELMRAIGETFDGEKSLPYLFDAIVRTRRGDRGEFLGELIKDRSSRLPQGVFPLDYAIFREAFGDDLARGAEPAQQQLPLIALSELAADPPSPTISSPPPQEERLSAEQADLIRDYLAALEIAETAVSARLIEYGCPHGLIDELSAVHAEMIIAQLADAYTSASAKAGMPAHAQDEVEADEIPF